MAGFRAELLEDLRSKVPFVMWATTSFVVAVSGPFGSYGAMTLGQRFLFWPLLIGIGIALGSVIRALVYGPLGLRGRLVGSILITALVCLVLCPPLFVVIRFMFAPMFGHIVDFLEVFLLVASLTLGLCALRLSAQSPDEAEDAPIAADDAGIAEPRLLRRLEPGMRGELWAISVRDHYVDVQTSKGKSSLLMRFSDAMAEAEGAPGAQVHRSHWVAWAGVGSVCRENGKMNLHLRNGSQIPVSRNHRPKVDSRFPLTDAVKTAAA